MRDLNQRSRHLREDRARRVFRQELIALEREALPDSPEDVRDEQPDEDTDDGGSG